ncbi:MAG: anti-sigma factor [Proteobacteria bacterium]|nr:anti-sigma factor [Pseudomonadota bacterium]
MNSNSQSIPTPIGENDLHAQADDRLAGPRRVEVEIWLASHPQEAGQVAAWRAQNAMLHRAYDNILDAPLPARLVDASRRSALAANQRSWHMVAAVAWLALGGVIGYWMHDDAALSSNAQSLVSLPRQAAIAHAVYSPEVRHPVEVGAEQEAHLSAWLSKRLGAPLKPPHLENAGYALVGGRLLPGESAAGGGAVAQFMYQASTGQRLTLYVRNDVKGSSETAFRTAQEGGIRVFYWLDGRFGYALSGDTAAFTSAELLRIATLVYRQLNP